MAGLHRPGPPTSSAPRSLLRSCPSCWAGISARARHDRSVLPHPGHDLQSEERGQGQAHGARGESAKNLTGSFLFPAWTQFKPLLPADCPSAPSSASFVGILPGAGGDIGLLDLLQHRQELLQASGGVWSRLPRRHCSERDGEQRCYTGGALIPLLTLGIPGSGVAAITAWRPDHQGPDPWLQALLRSHHRPDRVLHHSGPSRWPMSLWALPASVSASRSFTISTIPMTILAPMIVALSTVGSYAVRQSIFDVWVMLVFGFIGYFMRKYGFATAPVVLAMILGPIAESKSLASDADDHQAHRPARILLDASHFHRACDPHHHCAASARRS